MNYYDQKYYSIEKSCRFIKFIQSASFKKSEEFDENVPRPEDSAHF